MTTTKGFFQDNEEDLTSGIKEATTEEIIEEFGFDPREPEMVKNTSYFTKGITRMQEDEEPSDTIDSEMILQDQKKNNNFDEEQNSYFDKKCLNEKNVKDGQCYIKPQENLNINITTFTADNLEEDEKIFAEINFNNDMNTNLLQNNLTLEIKTYDCKTTFALQDDALFAIMGKRKYYIGNFCIKILEEETVLNEIFDGEYNVLQLEEETFWKVVVYIGTKTYIAKVQNSQFLLDVWLANATKNRAYLEDSVQARKFFKQYVNLNVLQEDYMQKKVFKTNGWKKLSDGNMYYLTNRGVVGYPEIPLCSSDRYDFIYDKTQVGSKKIYKEFFGMRNIIPNKYENAVTLQHFTCISVLTNLFRESGYQIKFLLALIGKTNSRKTSCGNVFTKLFNRNGKTVADINFTSTKIGILEVLETFSDAVVMVDDLTPSEEEKGAKDQAEKLEIIVRAYGDRVARRRSASYAKESAVKEFIAVNGCCLVTGETFGGSKSSRSRVIQLNFEEGDVDNKYLSYYQNNLEVLPTLIYDFLVFVTQNINQVINEIKCEVPKMRAEFAKYFGVPRLAEYMGIFSAGISIFFTYAVNRGYINKKEAQNQILTDVNMIFKVLKENDSILQLTAPGIIIIQAMIEGVTKGTIRRMDIKDIIKNNDKNQALIEDDLYYYIQADPLWEIARRYCDFHHIYFPYKNGRDIVPLLKNENLIMYRKEGSTNRSTHKLTVGKTTLSQRFLYIKKEVVQKIWNNLMSV